MRAKAGPAAAAILAAAVFAAPAGRARALQSGRDLLPPGSGVPGWTADGPPESYDRGGLYGYIDGGAEAFLQYGFERVDVGRYRRAGPGSAAEITVDVYRMAGDQDAFGVFSTRRDGGETGLALGDIPGWAMETQASLAAGPYYVNIVGFGTSEEDLKLWARLMARALGAAGFRGVAWGDRPGPLARLPRKDIRPDSVRWIRGPLAAQAESELLTAPSWMFAAGATAASARYAPDGRKLIVVDLPAEAPGLMDDMARAFAGHLTGVARAGAVLTARNERGFVFLFSVRGRRAALVVGRADEGSAQALLAAAF
jgi:hypothetical protein